MSLIRNGVNVARVSKCEFNVESRKYFYANLKSAKICELLCEISSLKKRLERSFYKFLTAKFY